MTELLRLLAVYYLCDAAAAVRPLSAAEVAGCIEVYGRVKSQFSAPEGAAPGSPDSVARNAAAYAAFKAWEAANPDLVEDMRRAARAQVAG